MGENQHREHQPQRPTGPRPGVGAADDEVRREIPTDEENQRRQNEPNCVGEKGLPARTGFHLA